MFPLRGSYYTLVHMTTLKVGLTSWIFHNKYSVRKVVS